MGSGASLYRIVIVKHGGTLKPESVSTKQERIAMLAKGNPTMALTTLGHFIDYEWVKYAYDCTRKDGAVGVDGQTGEDYAANLEQNLRGLIDRLKSGRLLDAGLIPSRPLAPGRHPKTPPEAGRSTAMRVP